jgi:hypothetical protein
MREQRSDRSNATQAAKRFMPSFVPRLVPSLAALLGMLCLTFDGTPALTITGHMSVLTMSHEGSWGADTQLSLDDALQNAIASCKKMHGLKIGCGGQVISIENGWLLGMRCGTRSILSSGSTRAEAEAAADRRENNMRREFVPNLPPCRRVVSVDPNGAIDGAASAPDSLAPTPSLRLVLPEVTRN